MWKTIALLILLGMGLGLIALSIEHTTTIKRLEAEEIQRRSEQYEIIDALIDETEKLQREKEELYLELLDEKKQIEELQEQLEPFEDAIVQEYVISAYAPLDPNAVWGM